MLGRSKKLTSIAVALAMCFVLPTNAFAIPPSPANDLPANAEVIGPGLPLVLYGTTVLAQDDINTTGGQISGIDSYMDGPDVFYSLTPGATDTYRVMLLPWEYAPLRSSDRRFTIYVYDPLTTTFVGGVRAPGTARPVELDVALNAGTEYLIGVDHDAASYDEFPFTLMVDQLDLTIPEDCASAVTLSSTLPVVVLNDIDGAIDDFVFTQSADQCGVSGTTPTTAPGPDHVYKFSPAVDGEYAIELATNGFDGVLYVDDSCGPFWPDGCLGASNHSTSGTSGAKHELVVVSLDAGKDYWIFVDDGSTTAITGAYALIIDDAFAYEMNELEPNDIPATATPLATPLNGGQLVGPADEDYWAVTGLTGDRVYAYVNNGGSSNSTLDTELRLYGSDGTTLIEFDDDGDGINSDLGDLYYIYSTTSSVIAGAQMTADGTHYLNVGDADSGNTNTIHRYRFHTGVEPASRAPLQECEPNNTFAAADVSGKNYFAGVIPTTDDSDFYAFEATVGDRIFIACDGDPERDSPGNLSANDDPLAFHAKLVVYDPDEYALLTDVSDSNTAQTEGGDYPAQGCFFVARATGTHYVEVMPQSTASQVGPTETYELAIFINEQAGGAGTEDVDPVVVLTPDYPSDSIAGTATDNAPGDSGICSVLLNDNDNLQITNLTFTPGDGIVTFDIELVNALNSGSAKLIVADCAGNTACQIVSIDVDAPVCDGVNFSNRTRNSLHGPIYVPDNDAVVGADGTIEITESGIISDVNVTLTIESVSTADIDCYLVSPANTVVELFTDRASSSAYDFIDTTFDDDGTEIIPILSSAEPYTGVWAVEDSLGLAQLNGEDALGTWKLNVRDDSSTYGSARLVRWSIEIKAGFAGPETFAGTASDAEGIASIVLSGATNVQIDLSGFTPGDTLVNYTVSLIDSTQNGSGTVTVTDLQDNTCQSVISLNGMTDTTGPANSGSVTQALTFKQEVQTNLPLTDPVGLLSTVSVPDSFLVGEVEASITVDTRDVGRIFSHLSKDGQRAVLLNRAGSDGRGEPGLTKDVLWIDFDDDAPEADDAHMEPALGTIPFMGLHQPDARGDVIADGISTDPRNDFLFRLAGLDSAGNWDMVVGDNRTSGHSYSTRAVFRRWSMTLKNPCGPERYVGTAMDLAPGSGIDTIALAGGAVNLTVVASFTPGDEIVDYQVELTDPSLPGSGNLEITDVAGATTVVPISLLAASGDDNLPVASGVYNPGTVEFEGTASDNQAGDSGLAAIDMAPFADNLQLTSVSTLPAATATFAVGLVDPMANGRGYVRVTDGCGLRSYVLVEIDAQPPVCSGTLGKTIRYFSGPVFAEIPNYNAAGITSSIVVLDTDLVTDVDLTFTIMHSNDSDIDMSLTSPLALGLFTDLGSTGDNFIDVTLDDEAAAVLPSSSTGAPFTGSWQPEDGSLSTLDGVPASGTYTIKVADDYSTYAGGTLDHWSLLISADTFPQRYDGRAEDNLSHDTGICSIELLPGASNLTLSIDPAFVPGDPIVRYSVELTTPFYLGSGTVRVTDCNGNYCEVPLDLGDICGDFNWDGVVDDDDYWIIVDALATCLGDGSGKYNPDCDLDGDDCVTLADWSRWVLCYKLANGKDFVVPKKKKNILLLRPAGQDTSGDLRLAP
ncbi:MAG: proprotein convertase P-domain-containing protein [Planctomycetota bacterium]